MEHVVLVVHLILTLVLIVLILLQRSEGGGLGLGTGGGLGGLATPQSTANALTKATTIVATCFFATSLFLAILASQNGSAKSILDAAVDNPPAATSESGTAAPEDATKQPITDEKPKSEPAVPLAN
jgi:preprotein translocase subunit SecG